MSENLNFICDILGGDPASSEYQVTTPYFENKTVSKLLLSPCDIPGFAYHLSDQIIDKEKIQELLHLCHLLNGISAGGYGPPLVTEINTGHKYLYDKNRLAAIEMYMKEKKSGIPRLIFDNNTSKKIISADTVIQGMLLGLLDLATHVISIAENITESLNIKNLLNEINKDKKPDCYDLLSIPFKNREIASNNYRKFFESVDMEIAAYGSRLLAEGIQAFIEEYFSVMADIKLKKPLIIQTSYGNIAFLTKGNDTITEPCFMLIDPGGNDFYDCDIAVTNIDSSPVSFVIDFEGDDQYGNISEANRIASAAVGYSMIADICGNDSYYSSEYGLAYSVCGYSILDDRSGDDLYVCNEGHSQGSAFFGSALLIDRQGDDEYIAGSYSQGFGCTFGTGILLDRNGNDKYLAPSGTFTQGAAKGRWADANDGFSIGGGCGILIDLTGSDEYLATGFSQGSSYYHGLGILSDISGNDYYDSETFSQGSAAHTSLACFIDMNGDDYYNTRIDSSRISQSMGYGRDISQAFFIEEKGDDRYRFGNKCFGVGDINGTGIAVDLIGTDFYLWISNNIYTRYGSFGSAQELGKGMSKDNNLFAFKNIPTTGIAIDFHGKDSYKRISGTSEEESFLRNHKSIKVINTITRFIRQDK